MLPDLFNAIRAASQSILHGNPGGGPVGDGTSPDLRFERLPIELQLDILRADPGAALSMMDVSHDMERLVAHDLLPHLLDHCGNSAHALRQFISKARRAGRSAEQIFALATALGGNGPAALRSELLRWGLVTPRLHNAMSDSLVRLITRPGTLIHLVCCTKPILTDEDLSMPDVLAGTVRPRGLSQQVIAFSTMTIQYAGLHLLVHHAFRTVGEGTMLQVKYAQHMHGYGGNEQLVCPPGSRPDEIAETARQDALSIARMFRLLLSADTLSALDGRPTPRGLLYYPPKPIEAVGGNGHDARGAKVERTSCLVQ